MENEGASEDFYAQQRELMEGGRSARYGPRSPSGRSFGAGLAREPGESRGRRIKSREALRNRTSPFWSRVRESNPPPRLGKLMPIFFYRS